MRLNGIYQPNPRRAYGRRKFHCALVEDLPETACLRLPDVPASAAEIVRADTGRRYILCPMCRRRCTALYTRGFHLWECRVCAGIGYASEYTLRRPEAAVERRHELRRRAKQTKSPEIRKRRLARVEALSEAAILRQSNEDARESRAFVWAALPLLIKEQAREAKRWRRFVLAVLRNPPEVAREWLTVLHPDDTPAWVIETLVAFLLRDTDDAATGAVQVPSEQVIVSEATAYAQGWLAYWREEEAA